MILSQRCAVSCLFSDVVPKKWFTDSHDQPMASSVRNSGFIVSLGDFGVQIQHWIIVVSDGLYRGFLKWGPQRHQKCFHPDFEKHLRTGEEMAMSQNRGTPGTLSHSWLMDGYSPQIYGHNGWLMDGYSPQIYGHNGWLMDGYSHTPITKGISIFSNCPASLIKSPGPSEMPRAAALPESVFP